MISDFVNSYTANLREFFTEYFSSIGINAYYQTADSQTDFPYITWELKHIQSCTDDNRGKQYIIEINSYHKSSTLILDNVLDFLEKKLDSMSFNREKYFININLAYNRIDIEDSREIKIKRINFEVKYFIKEC